MPVTIYTRPTCAPCRTIKQWLKNKGISYEERNVDDPSNAKEAFAKSGFTMVPVTVVGDQVIAGMNIALISKALML